MHALAVREQSGRPGDATAAAPFSSARARPPWPGHVDRALRMYAAPISPLPAQEARGNPVLDDTMPNLERTHMRALHSPRTHTANTIGPDATVARLSARGFDLRVLFRLGAGLVLAVAALLLGAFAPSAASAGSISGTVFEDLNYAGGAGRSFALSHGIPLAGARVEVYDGATGLFKGASTTNGTGTYTISQGAGTYIVRVVGSSVASVRSGFSPGLHFAVPTFRVNASSGVAVGVANEIGGHQPAAEDGANAGSGAMINTSTFDFIIGPIGVAQSGAQVSLATGASVVSGVDFGYNFDTVVNVNPFGAGSLSQVLFNASGMSNFGLAQEG